jgi:hypothetical protein
MRTVKIEISGYSCEIDLLDMYFEVHRFKHANVYGLDYSSTCFKTLQGAINYSIKALNKLADNRDKGNKL